MAKRAPELTRVNFVGQPLRAELYKGKLKPFVWGRSLKTFRRLHVGGRYFVLVASVAATVHRLCSV
jgi:hypothetical protein